MCVVIQVDRVICHYVDDPSSETAEIDTQYYCKWRELGYSECTWEFARDILPEAEAAVTKYRAAELDGMNRREGISLVPPTPRKRTNFEELTEQPVGLSEGMQLHDYQLAGCAHLCCIDSAALVTVMASLTMFR